MKKTIILRSATEKTVGLGLQNETVTLYQTAENGSVALNEDHQVELETTLELVGSGTRVLLEVEEVEEGGVLDENGVAYKAV